MESRLLDFIQQNSPDGGFLQSEYWRKFQESYGRKTFEMEEKDEDGNFIAHANIITHSLPIVGDYFYVPRGPVIKDQRSKIKDQNYNSKLKVFLDNLIDLAEKNSTGWIRVELNSDNDLEIIRDAVEISGNKLKIVKSPVDVQPREILVLDITRNEDGLLAKMKQKSRYNVRLAEKRGVKVLCIEYSVLSIKYFKEFLRLVKITSKRDKITAHPENYYRKMFEKIPSEILKLYVAEYGGKIIAENIVSFFGNTATYMHGASDNIYREVMAPYLLQWRAILDAKKMGCTKYDLGGINTKYKNWEGITKFKTGFVPDVEPIKFPGCYDIVLKPVKYWLYRILRKIKP